MQEGIASKEIDGFGLIDLELVFDDHDEFEDGKSFEDENSVWKQRYLLLSNYLSLLFLILLRKIGILSG